MSRCSAHHRRLDAATAVGTRRRIAFPRDRQPAEFRNGAEAERIRDAHGAPRGHESRRDHPLHGGDGEYSNGIGRVLADGPYARPGQADNQIDKNALLSLARKWIKRNTRS